MTTIVEQPGRCPLNLPALLDDREPFAGAFHHLYLNCRFRIAVPEETFRLWYTAHKPICTYHTLRP
jgi:hypothetical protein